MSTKNGERREDVQLQDYLNLLRSVTAVIPLLLVYATLKTLPFETLAKSDPPRLLARIQKARHCCRS